MIRIMLRHEDESGGESWEDIEEYGAYYVCITRREATDYLKSISGDWKVTELQNGMLMIVDGRGFVDYYRLEESSRAGTQTKNKV